MTGPSSGPRGEQTPAPGITWQQRLVRVEQLVDDDAPIPRPNRQTRRALARSDTAAQPTPQGADVHQRIFASEVARALTARRHPNSLTGPAWQPGHRATQASPRTVRLWHDGPDEQAHLDRYAQALRAAGYTVTAEHSAGKRPRLRITQQSKEK